jgi:alkanesulfonate monooxygenase SsuD/methylene tetrahydromethanopterin reductase-like flavin-dependent oxidoreductase (luciferase family)
MRIGVQLPEVERVVPWPEYAAMARAAEEVGFDSIWVGDHLLYADPPRGPWEAWTTMAALAAVTERVTIGPLVACLAFHPAAVLAKMAATVAEISGGRFVLGVGAGWNDVEFRAFGIPYERRVDRFESAFTTVRRLLAGERDGDAVLLPEPRRVPLMVGSNGRRMLDIALPHVDAWNTWYVQYGNTAEGFASLHAGLGITGVERSACALVALDGAVGARQNAGGVAPITGPPATIAARLAELGDAGADEIILVLDPITEGTIRDIGEICASMIGGASR